MNTFAVGEIALYHRPGNLLHGQEVMVTNPLTFGPVNMNNGETVLCWYYLIRDNCDKRWAGRPENLRKRRPPQDWVSLCKLEERPVEEIA